MTSAYTINLNPNITTPVKTGYTFKAGDKGITFNIVVNEMDDATGMTAKICFMRANGASVEATLSGTGPTFSYTTLGNEFAVPGIVVADVKFYNSTTQRYSTASFVFNVIGDTLDGLGGDTGPYSDQLETLSAEFEDTLHEYQDAFGLVGAIIPKGSYNAATTYTALDLVEYNGSSWLCRQECTGVTPSTMTNYWQLFAASGDDAQYVSYDNSQSGLTSNNVQTAIDELSLSSGEKRRKIVFLSDSYGDSSNADSHGKTFVDYIRQYLGIGANLIDIHANGGGFIGDTSVQWTTSWKNLIEENLSSIGDPDLITDVIFAGGANDIGKGFANINSAINTAVAYCKTTFPNCKVSVASNSLIFDATNLRTRALEQLQSYRRCAKYGARYLCNTEFIMMISTYLKSDHVHPNDSGIDALGYYMAQAIATGTCTVDYSLLSPASTTHNNGNLYMRTKMINQSLSIFGNGGFILFDKVGSGSLSNDGELATITDSCFLGRAFMMPCVIRIDGSTIHHGVVYLDDWYNGTIRMKLFDYNVSSTISYSSHLEVFVNATFTNDGNAITN